MDLTPVIQELRHELERLNEAIAMLEGMASAPLSPPRRKRGRKSMGADERVEVSERMKKYWASRREVRTA